MTNPCPESRRHGCGNAKRPSPPLTLRRGVEAREERQQSEQFRRSRQLLTDLRFALNDVDLGDLARQTIATIVASDLFDEVFAEVWRRLVSKIKDNSVMIHRETRPLGIQVVSFTSLDPEWEAKLRDFILDLIGPTLETIFTCKRKGK